MLSYVIEALTITTLLVLVYWVGDAHGQHYMLEKIKREVKSVGNYYRD